jgi:hypothetical protein
MPVTVALTVSCGTSSPAYVVSSHARSTSTGSGDSRATEASEIGGSGDAGWTTHPL